jgi:hypothetical protein
LFKDWNDVVWLKDFFEKNIDDLSAYFKITNLNQAIYDTIEDAEKLECLICDINENSNLDELFRHLEPQRTKDVLLGKEKATVTVRREADYGLSQLGNRVIRKGDFLFPAKYATIPIRLPNSRKIQHICVDELAEAMHRILQTCIGTTRDALSAETTRVYGFNRAGQNISLAMSKAIDMLIETGRVEELEGKLRIKR